MIFPLPAPLLGLAMLLAGGGSATAQARDRDEVDVSNHSIPVNRATTAQVQRAEEHLAKKRWKDGLGDLQELLESHADELMESTRPRGSDYDVHPGVSVWVRERLRSLPEDVQEFYRVQHGERARIAFEKARATRDLPGLTRVAARWPLTEAAALAWWTIGDIEMESGHVAPARAAWLRALEADAELAVLEITETVLMDPVRLSEHLARLGEEGRVLPDGVRGRLEYAAVRSSPGGDEVPVSQRGSELELPGPGEGARGTPGEEASTWPAPLELPPHPFVGSQAINLHAARAGDAVLVSTSLELLCVNAYTGTKRWTSGEPRGWSLLSGDARKDFFYGIDKWNALIAPAASDTIAIAALQVPVTQHRNENFNQIAITRIIPDRRLFAFDLETGDPLWDHAPPLDWDGESGDFSTRMRVAGPPVIAASRVFVPTYRLQGRIDCHVACYDLFSGELMWSTPVISGQLELNMFNRHVREYSAPPLCIAGDKVIFLTQLGTVAALDLFSGALLWETKYDQVSVPIRHSPNAPRRPRTWRNTAPVVADGVVVATPIDSDRLLGLDIETGEMLWTMRQSECKDLAEGRAHDTDTDLLLGADENTVFVGGQRFVAMLSVPGLAFDRPDLRGWQLIDGFHVQDRTSARPVLAADRIVVPTSSHRIEIDRFTGRRLRQGIAWRGDLGGNLLLGDGMLFTLSSHQLNGYFEWDLLLDRARADLESDPDDVQSGLRLASLLAERGHAALELGRSEDARAWLDEAARILGRFLENDPSRAGPEIAARMHHVLRSRARALIDLADSTGALESLRAARPLAPERGDRRDVLVEEAELLRDLGRSSAQAGILDELEKSSADLMLRAELAPSNPGLKPTPEAYAKAIAYAGPAPSRWRLAPLLARAPESPLSMREPSVGMWVAFERAELDAIEGDVAGELHELHRVLELWRGGQLPRGDPSRIASERITALLAREGRADYEPFEERARILLELGLEGHEKRRLRQVAELFPHSTAARRANDLLLEWALESGAVAEVAEIVLGELSLPFDPERSTERDAQMLVRLGGALEAGGNTEYLSTLLPVLAVPHPDLVSPLPAHAGRTLAEIARATLEPVDEIPLRTFSKDCRQRAIFNGRHDALGVVPLAQGALTANAEVLVFAREENIAHAGSGRDVSICAFGSSSPEQPLWTDRLDAAMATPFWNQRVAFGPGVVLIATKRGVIAYEREGAAGTAIRRFTWAHRGGDVSAVFANSGVVIVQTTLPGKSARLYGLDIATGTELWHTDIEADEHTSRPVCGEGRAVLLPFASRSRAIVIDLYTGRRTLEFEMPPVRREEAEGSWIENGRLIVPWFEREHVEERNQVLCVDLATGNPLWRVPIADITGGDHVLQTVVRNEGSTFLLLRSTSSSKDGSQDLLVDLRTTLGITGSIAELSKEKVALGLPRGRRIELDTPLVFLRATAPGERDLRLNALQLPYGTIRWAARLPLERDLLASTPPPLPATGAATVGVILSEKSQKWSFRTNLYLFDRYSGERGETQPLDKRLGSASEITIHALGDSLLIAGEDLMLVMR